MPTGQIMVADVVTAVGHVQRQENKMYICKNTNRRHLVPCDTLPAIAEGYYQTRIENTFLPNVENVAMK